MTTAQWFCGPLARMSRAALITALLTSCTAQVGIGGESSATGGSPMLPHAADPISGGAPGQCGTRDPGPAPIRRLTRSEYNRTVHDLLGDETKPAAGFIPEEMSLGFNNNANALSVSPILAEQYVDAAEGLAARAVRSPESLMRCGPSGVDDACVERFIRDFTRFAFRRPLLDTELQRYLSAYSATKANLGLQSALEVVVGSVLLSPRFLYRAEHGDPTTEKNGIVRLTSWETASRLSYQLWGSMPDRELFEAADRNQLSTPAEVELQARRMLSGAYAMEVVADFQSQWLELDQIETLEKDPTVYPDFSSRLARLLAGESRAFLDHVTWHEPNGFAELFTANYSFMPPELAAFYGAPMPMAGGVQRVDLPADQRAGILTQAGLLALHAHANQSSPVHRGKFVRQRLLCQTLPPPPANLVIKAPDLDPKLTTRERFAQHSVDPTCGGCHQLMDPVGLGFENYDAAGRWRSRENDKPIDASGNLLQIDVAGSFNGAVELGRKLSESNDVQACFCTQWFRYANGRAETEADACSLAALQARLKAAGGNLPELVVALTQTDSFLYRRTQQP